jgi:Fic family protein
MRRGDMHVAAYERRAVDTRAERTPAARVRDGASYRNRSPRKSEVASLMEDLLEFMERDDLPAVAQAAIAPAQVETIYPFIDGDGRLGRCLGQLILRRRGVVMFTPPVALIGATPLLWTVDDQAATGVIGRRPSS